MNTRKSSAELKALAREQLLGNYPLCIGTLLTQSLILLIISESAAFLVDLTSASGLLIYNIIYLILLLLSGVFTTGMAKLYLGITRKQPVRFLDLFYGLRYYADKSILLNLFEMLITLVCMAPFIVFWLLAVYLKNPILLIPMALFFVVGTVVLTIILCGISQAFFLLIDYPDASAISLLKQSMAFMRGNKGHFFYVIVSFIGLSLLSVLSCGLASLWITPYMQATLANLYLDITKEPGVTVEISENSRQMGQF